MKDQGIKSGEQTKSAHQRWSVGAAIFLIPKLDY
jgi:hypothetical protein